MSARRYVNIDDINDDDNDDDDDDDDDQPEVGGGGLKIDTRSYHVDSSDT